MADTGLTGEVEVAVVGAGLMGSGAAWALSRRGHEVALLERFGLRHRNGSSHGSARIVRRAYADPLYVRLTGRAMRLWHDLEHDAGRALLNLTGAVDHGTPEHVDAVAAALAEAGVEHERLSPASAARRWPGLEFDRSVLFHPQAGTVDADGAVGAMVELAEGRGAAVHPDTEVRRITPDGDRAELDTARGTLRARRVVVAAGAWVGDLLGGLVPLPDLTVTQQNIFHFPRRDTAQEWPVTIHWGAPVNYSTPGGRDGGPDRGRKVAEYHDPDAVPTSGDARSGVVNPDARTRVTAYVRRWLPGLRAEPFNEATCVYTHTPSEDFVLDRRGPIVVCAPCSGHGAKFAPLIGELTADLFAGGDPADHRFSLAAHTG